MDESINTEGGSPKPEEKWTRRRFLKEVPRFALGTVGVLSGLGCLPSEERKERPSRFPENKGLIYPMEEIPLLREQLLELYRAEGSISIPYGREEKLRSNLIVSTAFHTAKILGRPDPESLWFAKNNIWVDRESIGKYCGGILTADGCIVSVSDDRVRFSQQAIINTRATSIIGVVAHETAHLDYIRSRPEDLDLGALGKATPKRQYGFHIEEVRSSSRMDLKKIGITWNTLMIEEVFAGIVKSRFLELLKLIEEEKIGFPEALQILEQREQNTPFYTEDLSFKELVKLHRFGKISDFYYRLGVYILSHSHNGIDISLLERPNIAAIGFLGMDHLYSLKYIKSESPILSDVLGASLLESIEISEGKHLRLRSIADVRRFIGGGWDM